jgi:glycosyltransferase involved in cell wall biosynthesis
MPFSSNNGKSYIKDIVKRFPHDTMLDVGCGSGTYAKMFPNHVIDGVEIWEPYVSKYDLHSLYFKLYIEDARSWVPEKHYDIAFVGDVLEHMTREEAIALLNKVKGCASTVIISIPLGHYPQDEYEGNPYERHVVDHWTDEAVIEAFGKPNHKKIEGEIGVYVWSIHKPKLKIAVYAISKNEEKFVERFCASAVDADHIIIADTGSTDNTVKFAEECGATVYHIHIRPWRFDLARNAALALIPADVDICISLDLDEILEPGWRQSIEEAWEVCQTTNLWYYFDWGNGLTFPHRKIHSRHAYHWFHPCHEDLRIDPRVEEVKAWSSKLLVTHHPDPTKSRGQYMEILEAAVKEDDRQPTHYFYYSRELTYYGRWDEAIVALKKYLSMDAASNQNERCYAMRLLGKSYGAKQDWTQAEKWYLQAAGESPHTREPWCELGMLYYHQQRWPECFAMCMRALQITDRQLVYTNDPAVWGYWAHDLLSIAAWHMGLDDISIEHAKLALDHAPDDERLKANLDFVMGRSRVKDESDGHANAD